MPHAARRTPHAARPTPHAPSPTPHAACHNRATASPPSQVNCLSPGFCDTERFDAMAPERKVAMLIKTLALALALTLILSLALPLALALALA